MSSTPTDLDGLRSLIALKTSESGRGVKNKSSEDEWEGKTKEQGLLHPYRKFYGIIKKHTPWP
jgi:hypothetical protein